MRAAVLGLLLAASLPAVDVCRSAAVYEPCDIVLELTDAEAQAHPNPYVSVELRAEFRSPDGGRTKVMSGYFDGGRTFRIRFSPDYVGRWDLRILSNLGSVDRQTFSFQATEPTTPGFVEVFNTRYFRYSAPNTAHYWMGDQMWSFATIPWETFRAIVDRRAEQKFTHVRGLVLGTGDAAAQILADPEAPVLEHFRDLDRRIAYLNSKGITADLVFADRDNQLADVLSSRRDRERFIRYVAARYSAFNITWQGLREFETYDEGRKMLKEIYGYVDEWDPYRHPRSTHTVGTSSPLKDDGWMTFIMQQTSAESLMAIDYEANLMPVVAAELAYEDSGAGGGGVSSDEMRKLIWSAAARGHFVTFANTGTAGVDGVSVDARWADSPGARYMTVFRDFIDQTRWFDLQPYYGVLGGVSLSLQYTPYLAEEFKGVEYIVYQKEPGSVELMTPKDGYDVSWYNPIDGSWLDQKKKFKGERFRSPSPDNAHDWVLYVRREGKKQSFNEKFFLEARRVKPKDIETAPSEVPFEIQFPDAQALTAGESHEFNATLTKSTATAQRMLWLWTAEVAGSGYTARVIGAEQFGRFRLPEKLTDVYPATLSIRLLGLDGAGRLYEAFKAYRLERPAP